MMKTLFVLAAVLVAGCAATVGHLDTPSGRPEVTVRATVEDAQKESLRWLLANGYVVASQDAKSVHLAGDKDVTPSLVSSLNDGSDIERVSFNYFASDSLTTTIYMSRSVIIRRRVTSISPGNSQEDYDELQQALNQIAQNISASKK